MSVPLRFLVCASAIAACAAPDPAAERVLDCPPLAAFPDVSAVLERRCATLDCHGQPGRPLRLYSQIGLRRPEPRDPPPDYIATIGEYKTGGEEPTTVAEIADNHRAVCALEPEVMGRVVAGQAGPSSLTLVRKPRLAEKHKGGQIWEEGGDGDVCLTSWIAGELDPSACFSELGRR